MQNEPNFQKPKMTLNPLLEMSYEKSDAAADPKNEPNQTQFQPSRNNAVRVKVFV